MLSKTETAENVPLYFANVASLENGFLSGNRQAIFWKAMVQDNNNKQGSGNRDDKTAEGTEILAISKTKDTNSGKIIYKYLKADGTTEGTLRSNETVVLYYRQIFINNSTYGKICGADWGNNDYSINAPTKVTYKLFVGDELKAETSSYYAKDADDSNWMVSHIGALLNSDYEIDKITVDGNTWNGTDNDVSVDRNREEGHEICFYIKSVHNVNVTYQWINAPDNMSAPTDGNTYNVSGNSSASAELVSKAKEYKSGTIVLDSKGISYRFSGWYQNPNDFGNSSKEVTDTFEVTTDNHTLYGYWIPSFVIIDLNNVGANPRFQKNLENAPNHTEYTFKISVTNDANASDEHIGTATVSQNDVPVGFTFKNNLVLSLGAEEESKTYTYTVKEEPYTVDEDGKQIDGSEKDFIYDNEEYTMSITVTKNVDDSHADLDAEVSITKKPAEGEDAVPETSPITFTNTYISDHPIYVYGRYMHNGTQLKGDNVTVNNEKVHWNEDSTSEKAKDYYITFGKIARGTKEEAKKGEQNPELLFNKDDGFQLDDVFSGIGNASSNGVELTNVNSWGDVHACPGAASYNGIDAGLTTETPAWHLDGDINVYKVTYDDGVDASDPVQVKEDTMPHNPEGYFFSDFNIASEVPERDNYTFDYWMLDGQKVEGNKIENLSNDVTLVAHWTKQTANVTFEIIGGTWDTEFESPVTVQLENGSVKLSRAITIPTGTHKAGFEANSSKWYKNNVTGSYININNETVTDDVKYILKFDPIEYKQNAKVTFKIENGTWTDTKNSADREANIKFTEGHALLSTVEGGIPEGSAKDGYTNDKWYKENSPSSRTEITDINAEDIYDDATYVLVFEEKTFTVAYDWGNPSHNKDLPKTVSHKYSVAHSTEEEINALKDTTYPDGYSFAGTEDGTANGKKGTWTFSGWKSYTKDTDNNITFHGSWEFTADPVKVTVTFKIEGGTWDADGNDNAPKTAEVDVTTGTGYLKAEQLPEGTHTPDADHYGTGFWKNYKDTDITTIPITIDTSFTYVFNGTTVADKLGELIQKEFKAQYNYSTEATFAATAEVTTGPAAKPYAVEETPEVVPEEARIYDGTVTLKTGETASFTFSAKDRMADVLTPNTHYTVRVSEDKGSLSKVTYDTTKYILTFDTNQDAVVGNILIWKDGEDGKTENNTITFHNIYTYKRHHSSDDGGNGGKKDEKPTVEITDDDALGLNDTDHFAYIVGYGNGEVRPQNSITRAEVAAIFFRLLEDDVRDANYTRQNKFTDVSNDAWYCSAVSTLSAMGIISGYPDATFRPNASITRAEFAAIATRFDVNGDKTPVSFSDIAGHWAKDEIAVAANNGWVNGYEDGSFRPQNKITRAETMSLVNRVLNRRPETAEDLLENMTKWTDNADTNAWYYLAVQEATNSHYYEYKENSQYEKWTELRETRDWSELDK